MSWPSTPLTPYVASSPPSIKADDLNSFQDAINRIIVGTYTLKNVVIDGVGGAVTGLPGPAGTNPAAATAQRNTMSPANVPKAWALARSGASPSIVAGFNVSAIGNGSVFAMRITMAQALASGSYAVLVTGSAALSETYVFAALPVSSSQFDVVAVVCNTAGLFNLQTTAIDFSLLVFGLQ